MNWNNFFWTPINRPWHSFRQNPLCRSGVAIKVNGEILLIGDITKSGGVKSAFVGMDENDVVESTTDLLTNGSLDPVKKSLVESLNCLSPEDVVFRKADGSPVNIGQMLIMIKENDPLVETFLRDVYGAAVRAVRVKNKSKLSKGCKEI